MRLDLEELALLRFDGASGNLRTSLVNSIHPAALSSELQSKQVRIHNELFYLMTTAVRKSVKCNIRNAISPQNTFQYYHQISLKHTLLPQNRHGHKDQEEVDKGWK